MISPIRYLQAGQTEYFETYYAPLPPFFKVLRTGGTLALFCRVCTIERMSGRSADGRESEAMHKETTAVYPGSFDPITLGHLNIIERTSRLFDRLVVALGINREKRPWFSPEERADLVRASVDSIPNVTVELYEGLTVDYVRRRGAKIMIRGVRPITDIPAEITAPCDHVIHS